MDVAVRSILRPIAANSATKENKRRETNAKSAEHTSMSRKLAVRVASWISVGEINKRNQLDMQTKAAGSARGCSRIPCLEGPCVRTAKKCVSGVKEPRYRVKQAPGAPRAH